LDIMQNKLKWWIKLTRGETIFKLQAFASKIFNDAAKKRIKKKLQLMDGDILTRTEKWVQVYGSYDQTKQMVIYIDVKGGDDQFFTVPKGWDKMIAPDPERMMLTWPVPWFNSPLADRKAWQREKWFLQSHHLDAKSMTKFKQYRVYGLRRPIWVYPLKTNVRYQKDDLLIDFTLPAGSYASIIVDKLSQALK
jgi:tRNA(Glu) U13 pseudouridine synthase TruD